MGMVWDRESFLSYFLELWLLACLLAYLLFLGFCSVQCGMLRRWAVFAIVSGSIPVVASAGWCLLPSRDHLNNTRLEALSLCRDQTGEIGRGLGFSDSSKRRRRVWVPVDQCRLNPIWGIWKRIKLHHCIGWVPIVHDLLYLDARSYQFLRSSSHGRIR